MSDLEQPAVVVIGAGPAGLMAAETLADAGHAVTVAEAKPSPGRKFLMAGKSGLNITKAEPSADFVAHFDTNIPKWPEIISEFDNAAVQVWAETLGQQLFTGSSGRVFPKVMKASPLLRNWLTRLAGKGVDLQRNWHWQGWQGGALRFETPAGPRLLTPRVTVLALGGASWPRLGSDAAWVAWLAERGVTITPFAPSNAALSVDWSAHMSKHFGAPLKSVALRAGPALSRGEVTITAKGIEGGGIYPLSAAIRDGAALHVDLVPDLTLDTVRARLSRPRGKATLSTHLRKSLGLPPVKIALINEFARPLPDDLAPIVKALPIRQSGLQSITHAISSAGGIAPDALNESLMLRALPGVFAAGEMLDWDAPTGGYLISGCLASGRAAGRGAAQYLA